MTTARIQKPQLPTIAHVPMPLSIDGSAITNVIRELALDYEARGGKTLVALADNRSVDVQHAEVLAIDFTRECPREYWTPREIAVDVALGAAGLRRRYSRRLYRPVAEALSEYAPEFVFVHEGHYAVVGAELIARALPESRVYVYVHTPISRSIRPRELRRLIRPLAGVVCVSEFVAREVEQRISRSIVPVTSVLNGCDLDRFSPNATAKGAELTILFVGQVAPHKGPDLLVHAARLLDRRGHRFRLRIVGSGVHGPTNDLSSYERDLRALSEPLGSQVEFMPFVHRDLMPRVYQAADIMCVPSVWDDPCPLVVLEAMSSGLPIVASGRGGIPEQLAGTGVLIDPADTRAFADSLEALLVNGHRRRQLGSASRQRAEHLSWHHQLGRLLHVIDA